MSFLISLILILVIILGLTLAGKIYRFDKGNFLYRLTAVTVLSCTTLAFLEYEMTRVVDPATLLYLDPYHTIISSLTIYFSLCTVWTFTQPISKENYPHLNNILAAISLLTIGSIWAAILTSPYRVIEHIEYNHPLWQYTLRTEGVLIKVFHLWYAVQVLVLNLSFWRFIRKAQSQKTKQWGTSLFVAMLVFTTMMYLTFVFRGDEATKGFYYVSPWIMLCCAILGHAYTNFKLFTASPINALDDILESMSNLMVIADLNFEITYLNPVGKQDLKIFDRSSPNINYNDVAKNLSIGDWEEHMIYVKALKKKEKYAQEFEFNLNGNVLNYHIIFSPIFNSRNIKTGYLAIATNITKIKNAERQLKKYTTDLEQSNAELERFAYIASHDLKTPLRSVSSFLNLIQRKIEKKYDDPELEEFLKFAINGAGQMYYLIQDVLEYSKINMSLPIAFVPVDLNEVVKEVCINLQSDIEEKKAVLYAEPLPIIQSDKIRMIQLFQNIIENGIKYNNSERPTVYISYQDKNEHHQITFKDNGIGIRKEYNEQIFEMFSRLHRQNEYEGTGIGLAICKKIVTSFGGTIAVNSEEGKGSQFMLTFRKNINLHKKEYATKEQY